jgi:uncharacterized membrane protein AbrB (regulator of aidB expression)
VISRPVLALCVGLGLATGFGWAFTLLQIPLGWILGAMVGGAAVTSDERPAHWSAADRGRSGHSADA